MWICFLDVVLVKNNINSLQGKVKGHFASLVQTLLKNKFRQGCRLFFPETVIPSQIIFSFPIKSPLAKHQGTLVT